MPDIVTNIATDSLSIVGCDAEPIHVPGSIQPHGVLLAVGPTPELRVEQVSANVADWLGLSAENLLGQPIDRVSSNGAAVWAALRDEDAVQKLPVALGAFAAVAAGSADGSGTPLQWTAHRRTDGSEGFVLEAERRVSDAASAEDAESAGSNDAEAFFRFVNQTFLQLRGAPTRESLYARTVQEVRRLTGFDRVMLYRFHADEHGEVIAEACREDLDPFFGLHYPATDIPRQARALYVRSHIRLIADVDYVPVPLLAREPGPPLDLTYASLRSVSPIHVQYLKNMGVSASMSISIVQDDRLWGLIACHHETPHYLSYETRSVCELIGQTVAAQIVAYDAREEIASRETASRLVDALAERIDAAIDPALALTASETDEASLLTLTGATGAAVLLPVSGSEEPGKIQTVGQTPSAEDIRALIDHLVDNAPEDVFATNCLSEFYPPALGYTPVASGLLSVAVSRAASSRAYVLFFRSEVISTVNWAGDPQSRGTAVMNMGGVPVQTLSPRASFDLWKQTVRGQSRTWTKADRDAAELLRRAIVGASLRRAQAALVEKNAELRQSNDELDAFAFVASHDLREPLRGIRNYSRFLNEDYKANLGAEGGGMLETIERLTTRMDDFLDSLLEYSRVGSIDLLLRPVDMNVVLAEVLEVLRFRLEEGQVEVRIPRRLPSVMADAVRAAEVWTNLITNASKYSKQEQKWVEIGFLDSPANLPTIYYVRDNGIGIEERNHATVFLLFRRLHERDQFGGGTGSGLIITRRIVERHGGKIWIESRPGQGSTFYFTFGADAPPDADDEPAGTKPTV